MNYNIEEKRMKERSKIPYELFCRKFYCDKIAFPKVIEVRDYEDSYTWLFKNLTKNAKYAVLWEVYTMYREGKNFYGWLTLDINEYNPRYPTLIYLLKMNKFGMYNSTRKHDYDFYEELYTLARGRMSGRAWELVTDNKQAKMLLEYACR